MTAKSLKFKPYARLLTMLGDQLIRNEQVALSELVKNAYDADATWVKVSFLGFDENFSAAAGASIVIEDDGHGMSTEVIENHWVNPATPMKLMGKQGARRTTESGRIIQGEKGIGRFALLKLGRDVRMITRPAGSADENVLDLKLSKFDTDFLDGDRPMFLEDLNIDLDLVSPARVIVASTIDLGGRAMPRRPQGTRIEISPPAGRWSEDKVRKVYEDLGRLHADIAGLSDESPSGESRDGGSAGRLPFAVHIYRGDEHLPFRSDRRQTLDALIEQQTVFKIEGRYDDADRAFVFSIDGREQTLQLTSSELTGMPVFRDYLNSRGLKPDTAGELRTECGPFRFSFYVFDFSADEKSRFHLAKEDKALIKEHRIYLYRDDIRVYPYGDPDDDWLLIDVRRGTVRASEFLSNDQVVGFVKITQTDNPNLRDKTSREGLVDTGAAVQDFVALLQAFLAWVRKGPYAKYKVKTKQSQDVDVFKSGKVQSLMDEAVDAASDEAVPATVRDKITDASRQYKVERRYLVQRAENTEHLAGVGLSVEAASHDLMLAMQRVTAAIDKLVSACDLKGAVDKEALRAELVSMRGLLSFVQSQIGDMQQLFRSSKQRRKDIRVRDLVEKVAKIFNSLLQRHSIEVVVDTLGSPLVAKTTDAVLLQLLLNLFDNAAYWLQGAKQPRRIEILLDGNNGTMTFADTGPGFREEDLPYVFEPFYSGKGEDGRGLGLYIARQLLDRHEYTIDVATEDQRIASGANLVVSFVREQA